MRWVIMPYRRYFDFAGRSRRREFWLFSLLQFAAVAALSSWIFGILVEIGKRGSPSVDAVTSPLGLVLNAFGLFVIGSIIPSLAVQVRRFHDQELSGLLVLLNLIPCVGQIIVLVFMCLEGTRGPNRFGPDPKAP